MSDKSPLYICASPIGNLGDCSDRLLDTLKDCDLIYAEDTRVTSKLLNHFNITTKLKRLDENIMSKNAQDVIEQCLSGKKIAYLSDAGMPGVSDPGLRLVSEARKSGVEVEVLPGACAVINAYVSSGFNNSKFYFGGFLPKKYSERINVLKDVSNLDAVLIFYVSPRRLLSSLETINEILHDCEMSVCRELTKLHEEVLVGRPAKLLEIFKNRESIKGEIVICINNQPHATKADSSCRALAKMLFSRNFSTSDICKALMIAFDIPKKEAYDIALQVK